MSIRPSEPFSNALHLEPVQEARGPQKAPVQENLGDSRLNQAWSDSTFDDFDAFSTGSQRRKIPNWLSPALAGSAFVLALGSSGYVYFSLVQIPAVLPATLDASSPASSLGTGLKEPDNAAYAAAMEMGPASQPLPEAPPAIQVTVRHFPLPRQSVEVAPIVPLEEVHARAAHAVRHGDWQRACDWLRHAWNALPNRSHSYNLAVCLDRLGHSDAIGFYRQALALSSNSPDKVDVATVRARLSTLEIARSAESQGH